MFAMSAFRPVTIPALMFSAAVGLTACETLPDRSASAVDTAATGSPAKNVIVFIGDGMGVSTITAGRIFDGQSRGGTGEENELAFERFENLALIKTYNLDSQVPDSAGTATAILSGYKTNIGVVNAPADDLFAGCGDRAAPPTLSDIAAANNKAVGIVSTARLTHATPAAMYSHSRSRDWEADKDIEGEAAARGCRSIAAQLVDANAPVNLALGGGRNEFTDAQFADWTAQGTNHVYAGTGTEFAALRAEDAQDVLGLFNGSHMSFEADRSQSDEPSLADMTRFAIDNLQARDTDGFVLMVEAGRIDHAHHGSNAYRALSDLQALNEAVKTAVEKTGDETLILVTADHSHVFTMAGYPARGNPILGLARPVDRETGQLGDVALAEDGKPYTTLGYHNGANVRLPDGPALTESEVLDPNFQQQVAVPMSSETHGGEDVPLYATGRGAEQVRGVMEQNEIHDVIVKALNLK